MEQIIPITTLFLGALLVSLTPRLLSRRLSVVTAQSLALCLMALGLTMIPTDWQARLAGGEAGDRMLTFARGLGLTGLFFLAGTRFELNEVWQVRRVSLFVAVTGLLLFSLTAAALLLLGLDGGAAITAGRASGFRASFRSPRRRGRLPPPRSGARGRR